MVAWLQFGYHEMWKDEWQAWLMARDMGWGELLRALYYEGHPGLWYVYLKVWAAFGLNDALGLQLAHYLVVALAGGIFWYFTRLPWWLSLLLWMGYFPFFEYGVVSRGYVWVMVFGLALAGWLEKPEKKAIWAGVGLFLLCQTEVYGVLLGGALLVYAFFEHEKWKVFARSWFRILLSGYAIGVLVFLISVFPRASREELARAYVGQPFGWEVLGTSFQGNWVNAFWIGAVPDTNAFGVQALGIALSVLILLGMVWLFRRAGAVAWGFWAFQAAFFLFSVVFYTGGVRHWGMILIAWIVWLQLWAYKKPVWDWLSWLVVGSVLFFQLRYSVLAVDREVRYPYSNAREAAAFIRSEIPAGMPVVAINKFEAAPVVGYAGRPFYALPEGEPFTYFKWVEKVYLPPEEEIKLFAAYKRVNMVVVLSPAPLDASRYPGALLVRAFDRTNLKKENYFLYAINK